MLLIACVIIASTTLVVYIFGTLIKATSNHGSQVGVHTDEIVTVYDKSKRVMPVYYLNDSEEPANIHDFTRSEFEQVNALYYIIVRVS